MSTTRRDLVKGSLALPLVGSARASRAKHDVLVVGGGFAGVTAARELKLRGYDTVLLEARERLGGRTYTRDFAGQKVELGGTWVYQTQPFVWAEIERYGIALAEMPIPGGRQRLSTQGAVVDDAAEAMGGALAGLVAFGAQARDLVPRPYALPDAATPYDRVSMREAIDRLGLPVAARDALDAIFATLAHGPLERTSASEMLHVFALAGYEPLQFLASLSGTKLADGTGALIQRMADDSEARIEFQSQVAAIAQDDTGVVATTVGGETYRAKTAVITVPMNVLPTIRFTPALSPAKQRAIAAPHNGAGVKLYVDVAGDTGNVSVLAPQTDAINWVATQHHGPEGSLLIVFGSDPSRIDAHDRDRVQRELRRYLGNVEVRQVLGWDWNNDPFARGTWCVLQPGRVHEVIPHLALSEGRLFFASGDSAHGWRGFIDGAVESGYRVGREVATFLG